MKLLALTINGQKIPLPGDIQNNVVNKATTLGGNIFSFAFRIMFFGGVLLCLGFLLYGGFRWIVSNGEPKSIEDARRTIIFSCIGLVVVFLAVIITQVIGRFLGITFW